MKEHDLKIDFDDSGNPVALHFCGERFRLELAHPLFRDPWATAQAWQNTAKDLEARLATSFRECNSLREAYVVADAALKTVQNELARIEATLATRTEQLDLSHKCRAAADIEGTQRVERAAMRGDRYARLYEQLLAGVRALEPQRVD